VYKCQGEFVRPNFASIFFRAFGSVDAVRHNQSRSVS
jgi:hypothetical protein